MAPPKKVPAKVDPRKSAAPAQAAKPAPAAAGRVKTPPPAAAAPMGGDWDDRAGDPNPNVANNGAPADFSFDEDVTEDDLQPKSRASIEPGYYHVIASAFEDHRLDGQYQGQPVPQYNILFTILAGNLDEGNADAAPMVGRSFTYYLSLSPAPTAPDQTAWLKSLHRICWALGIKENLADKKLHITGDEDQWIGRQMIAHVVYKQKKEKDAAGNIVKNPKTGKEVYLNTDFSTIGNYGMEVWPLGDEEVSGVNLDHDSCAAVGFVPGTTDDGTV